MTVRVTLISPAASTATATARFEDGQPLTDAGRQRARRAAGAVATGPGPVPASGTVRCAQTARELGWVAAPVPELAGWSLGGWRGRSLADVAAAEPDAMAAWLSDPHFTPPGGESLVRLCGRVGDWLSALPEPSEAPSASAAHGIIAVVEPDVVRAALVVALDAPHPMFWRLDVRPLTATVLSGRQGRWNVRVGEPLDVPEPPVPPAPAPAAARPDTAPAPHAADHRPRPSRP